MKVKTLSSLAAALVLAVIAVGETPSAQKGNKADKANPQRDAAAVVDQAAVVAAQLPSYPLKDCVVSGEGLHAMGKPIDIVHDGKLVRLCCKGCKKMLRKKPAEIVAKIDAAVIAAQKPTYPLKKCVVSGEGLASMGGPIDVVHGTRLVQLCCDGCKKGFARKPERFLAKIDAALIETQKKSYPLKSCPVSGEPLGDGHDFLYGTQLVRTCCAGCEKPFRKDGEKLVAKIVKARK